MDDTSAIGEDLLGLARPLWGRFPQLDALLEHTGPITGFAWRRCLEQLWTPTTSTSTEAAVDDVRATR